VLPTVDEARCRAILNHSSRGTKSSRSKLDSHDFAAPKNKREQAMKIIAYDNFKPGVTLDDLRPYLRDEVSNVWRLWKAGIVRENFARADVGGVVIVFELDSLEQAKKYIEDFPLSKAGLLEWHYIALDAPLPLEFLFDSSVDVATPWDRTSKI
jgi:hypothetical protein